jgi:photosystem II stability/assembly factor-like uncharacterized protein
MKAIAAVLAFGCLSLAGASILEAKPLGSAPSTTQWRTMKIGAGGFVDGLDIAPDGAMVGRTDTNGAYRWTGASWRQLVTASSMPPAFVAANPVTSGQGVYEIKMAPSHPSIMYMLFDGYVFASSNKGSTWTQTSFAQVTESPNDNFRMLGQKMAVDPHNPKIVYVGTPQNGLFVTKDGGTTWSQVSGLPVSGQSNGEYPGITGLLFDPAIGGVVGGATQTIFASSYGNGVYESTDGGATWTNLQGGPPDVEFAAVSPTGAYLAAGNSGATLSSFAAGTWTNLTPPGQQGVAAIAIDPANSNELVVLSGGGQANLSWDGGSTWTGMDWQTNITSADIPWLAAANVEANGSAYLTVGAAEFSATTPNELIISAGTGVWNVTIPTAPPLGTLTYSDMSVGIENLVANEIIVPPGGDPVLASWDRPFFHISNLHAYPSTYGPVNSDNIVAGWSVDYASSNPKFLVGLADWWGTEETGYSTNGGRTWTNFPTDIPGGGSSFMGGTIAASTPKNIIWAPADGFNPYYTVDGGKRWSPVSLPGVSSWSGFDWAYYLNTRSVTADRVQLNTFYLYYNGVYKTTDGGRTWTQVAASLEPFAYNSSIQSVPGKKGNLFFTGGIQGNGTNPPSWASFYMSSDFGSTWTTIPNVLDVINFGFGAPAQGQSYPTIYIVGYVNNVYGIWQSTNLSQGWTQIGTIPTGELDQISTIAGDPNTGNVYVGFGGGGYAYLPAAETPRSR